MRVPRSKGLIFAGLLLGTLGITCGQPKGHPSKAITDSADAVVQALSPTPAFAQAADARTVTVADVAEKSVASVVNISATKVVAQPQMSPFYKDPFFREFFGRPHRGVPNERRQRSLGSGVIVSSDGLVITNNHVVERAEDVEVSLADGREFEAELLGADPKSDVAVLRVKGDVSGLKPLPIGDSSQLRLGEVVVAIGNPFGVGQTVTMGIVSAIGRANVGIVDYEDFIQTDAAINPGNSGGALVNMRGELVGVNTAILSKSGGYQGIGFAIPSNLAKPVMDSLVEHGEVVRGWLGVAIQELDGDLAKGLDMDRDKGVLISDVSPDGPAAKAGFKRGDLVVKMDGKSVTKTSKLRNRIAIAGPDAKVSFLIVRDGKELTLEATLGQLPGQLSGNSKGGSDDQALSGVSLSDINDDLRRRFRLGADQSTGVVVTSVDPTSRAARSGLRAGDVIVELNRSPVANLSKFKKSYKAAEGVLLLLIQRQGSSTYLTLRK